jgi:hypothetical protein
MKNIKTVVCINCKSDIEIDLLDDGVQYCSDCLKLVDTDDYPTYKETQFGHER